MVTTAQLSADLGLADATSTIAIAELAISSKLWPLAALSQPDRAARKTGLVWIGSEQVEDRSLQQVESDVEANVLLGDLRCGTRGTALSMEHRLVNAIYGDDATTAYTVGTSGGRLEVSVNGVKMIANPPSGSGSTAGIGGSRPAMRSAPADRSALRRSDCGAAAIGFTVSTDGTSTTVQFATPPQGSNFVVVAMTRGWCSRPEPRWSAALRCSGRCLIECCTSEVLRCKLQMKRRIALPHLGDLGCYCLQSRLISPEHSSRETSIDYFH